MGRFTNKIVVITGGTSGIGLAAARQFIKESATVVAIGRSPQSVGDAQKEFGANGIESRLHNSCGVLVQLLWILPASAQPYAFHCRFSATMRTRRLCPAFQSDLAIVSSNRRMRNCCVLNTANKRAGSIETGVRFGVVSSCARLSTLAATEARLYGKIRLNTNGWERGTFSMARVLEVVPIDRRFWPRGLWARRLQKRGTLQR
jgi:NAD(P)-dependent dehydrogenase (short-subunit alcohol dehydrogenase family)